MIGLAIGFLVAALTAALAGFSGIAGRASGIAKLAFVGLVLAFVWALFFRTVP